MVRADRARPAAWWWPGSLVLRGNAFNFPVWAPLEKLAQAVLAGMPSVVKPATPRHSSCASSSTRSPPARCIGRGLGASGAELGDLGLGDGVAEARQHRDHVTQRALVPCLDSHVTVPAPG